MFLIIQISGINYISNLLWALEILAWSPEYLVHSISVLGLLEALPYERTNWTNTPINSIVSILLPWYPQTMADLEKRKNALKCLKTDNPRVFWSTLKKLLPNKTRSTSGNPRPKYLKLEIPEEVKVTNAEAHECYVYLVELAVDTARNKNEKLIELIDQLGYMYEPTLTDYLDCLENGFEFDTDENTFEVWIKLRECMARIEPTEGKVIYKQIDRIRQLTEKMEPTDIRVKHREWYLGNRYLFDKGNYANRWKMLEDKKLSAVKEIFDEYGSEEVERFGSAVKNVHDVANKLGHFLKPKEMSSIIEKCFIGILSKEFTINCLISFVYTQGAEKLLETSLCHMEDEFTLEILSKIPFSLQLLDVINQVLDDDTAYWEKAVMPYGCYEDETEALKIIVEKLVACKRYVTAVNIIGHSECEAVINAECIYKLMKLAGTEESIGVETLDDYAVQKIIGWFQQQEDIDLELRSDIEFIYLPIRLQDAMEEDLLCPFHYFGITDLDIIADAGKSSEEKVENFRYLTSEERVENVMKQAEYFGYSGDRVKGLIFCSRIDEAKELSKKFNAKGWRTLVLSGSDSEEARAVAIERLAGEESEDALDYIISVDIFSEGVDVPEINQVIMLRPTESPIVFIQQLGRGLRKAENKEYVVVLDFIGNYRNNFMIPIALSGDRSYNKDNIRRYVTEGGRVIPGASTIHFDEISRKRIFQAIDNANFSDIKLIRENYTNLKNKLGHIPALADFDKYGEMDVLRIFDNNSLGSYYKFLVKYEKEYTIRLSEDEEKAIEFISKKLASGKRIHELELLKRTLQYRHGIIGRLRKHLSEKYHCEMDEYCTENVINMMTNEFPTSAAKKTYAQCVFLKKEQDDYGISDVYGKMLQNPEFCAILEELVDFGISRYKVNYSYQYQDTNLVLYQKYTYEDACRLLNWERNEVPLNIGGYKYDKKTKTFPIFINYDKQDNISDTTKYEDHFVAENRLIAISKSGRSMDSEDVQNFLNATERGIDVQLFVRKNKDDKISKEFYYLGRVIATGNAKQFVMPNTDKTAVEIEWELETPVREDIYQYIVNE